VATLAKGRQDDLVILFGFEWAPYHHYSKDKCPNTLYVGLTRAKSRLVVLQNSENEPLPFLDLGALPETVSAESCIPSLCDGKQLAPEDSAHPRSTSVKVTDLLCWLPFNEIENAANQITVECITPPLPDEENKSMKAISAAHENEEVSDLTGMAMQQHLQRVHEGKPLLSASELLRLVTEESAKGSYRGRFRQLCNRPKGFHWVSQDAFDSCDARFREIIRKDKPGLKFEYDVEMDITDLIDVSESKAKVVLKGRIDVLQESEGGRDPDTIIELKFVDRLQPTHQLQLAIYGWLYEKAMGSIPQLLLFSPKTNELRRVEVPWGKVMDDMVRRLLQVRHIKQDQQNPEFTDEEFLAMNLKIKEEMRK
jgi:PD-(D/E)XK nuclease superfamily